MCFYLHFLVKMVHLANYFVSIDFLFFISEVGTVAEIVTARSAYSALLMATCSGPLSERWEDCSAVTIRPPRSLLGWPKNTWPDGPFS